MTDTTPEGPTSHGRQGITPGPEQRTPFPFSFGNYGPPGGTPPGPTRLPGKHGYGFGALEEDDGFISCHLENTTKDKCFKISFKRLTGEYKNVFCVTQYKYNSEGHQIFGSTFQRIDSVHTVMLDTSAPDRWKVNFLAGDHSIQIVNYAADEVSNSHKQEFASYILVYTHLTLCRDQVDV